MMSMMLGLMFGFVGALALCSMLASLRRLAPAIAQLRRDLREPLATTEIRTTLLEHALIRLRPNRGPLRHMHRPKPIVHRLHRGKLRRAA